MAGQDEVMEDNNTLENDEEQPLIPQPQREPTYVPVNSKTGHPPRANPGAFDFFEKFWSNSPLCCQFRRSNAPPVRASKRVKSPTLQGKQNRLPLEINRIAYLWKQVLQNFQPLRISCSACLRSTL